MPESPVDRAAKALIESEDRAEGERWDDFEPDAPELQEARRGVRIVLTAARSCEPRGDEREAIAAAKTRAEDLLLDASEWRVSFEEGWLAAREFYVAGSCEGEEGNLESVIEAVAAEFNRIMDTADLDPERLGNETPWHYTARRTVETTLR